jgi:hypothetical protein
MFDRLIEIGRCYEMEVNVQIIRLMAISRRPYPVSILIHQKQTEYVEYFNYLGSLVTHDARCVSEIKSRVIKAKQNSTRKNIFTRKLDLNLGRSYFLNVNFCGI